MLENKLSTLNVTISEFQKGNNVCISLWYLLEFGFHSIVCSTDKSRVWRKHDGIL